jgi:hypothetical protein
MATAGGFSLCDIPLREKVHYEGFMQMNKKYPKPFQDKDLEKGNAATNLDQIKEESPDNKEYDSN